MARTSISDKIVESQIKIIDALKKYLEESNRKTVMFDEHMDRNIEKFEKVSKSFDEIKNSMSSYSETAKTVSKYLGMEEGTKRQIETLMSQMVNNDTNIQVALKKGESLEVKKQMVQSLLKLSENMEFNTENEKRQYKSMIADMNKNFESAFDWDKIYDKGTSMFFPLTQKFVHGAEVMRDTIVNKFPQSMRFLSEDMVEHYKQGIKTVTGMLKTQLSPILAPLEVLTGPFMAILKGGYILTKTLMSKSNDYEKETAKYSKATYKILVGDAKQKKKDKLLKKPEQTGIMKYLTLVGVLFLGFFTGLVKSLEVYWKPVERSFKWITGFFREEGIIGKFFIRIGKFFTNISKWFVKLESKVPKTLMSKLLGGLGKFIGKFLMPLMMIWEGIKGWIKGENLRDKILGAAAGMLGFFLELPEMMINGMLSLLGSDFRLDLGADAIMAAVNSITEWMYTNITEPFLDWLLVDLPNMFSNFSDSMGIFFDKISQFGSFIKDYIIDLVVDSVSGIPYLGEKVKVLEKYKSNNKVSDTKSSPESIGTDNLITKTQKPKIDTIIVEKAKAKAINEQIKGNRDTVDALNTTNETLTETNNTNKQIIQNQQNINVMTPIDGDNDGIPTDPENLGVMLLSNTWGGA